MCSKVPDDAKNQSSEESLVVSFTRFPSRHQLNHQKLTKTPFKHLFLVENYLNFSGFLAMPQYL